MMKIIGAAMMLISSVLFGYSRYKTYKSRPKELEIFIRLISAYRLGLNWNKRSLAELLSERPNYGFENYFERARELVTSSTYAEAFIEKNSEFGKMHLTNDDTKILKYFFEESGNGGLVQETSLCDKTVAALTSRKTEAEAESKKLAPLALKLAVLFGVCLLILVL